MDFVSLKALAGNHFVRPDQVIAVTFQEQAKCQIVMTGGVTIPVYEPAAEALAKIVAARAAAKPE